MERRLRIAHISDIHASHVTANLERLWRLFSPKSDGDGLGSALARLVSGSWHHRRSLIEPLIRVTHMREPYSLRRLLALLHSMRSHDVGHVVLTGDLANLGAASEMREVMRALRAVDYDDSALSVVPGNHDRFNLRESDEFEQFVCPRPYPHLDRPNEHVAIVGVDSTVRDATLDWRDALVMSSRGIIPIEQIEAADKMLAGLDPLVFKILCCHHHLVEMPPDGHVDSLGKKFDARLTSKAENAEQLLDVAKARGVSLILYGHRHTATADGFSIRGIRTSCAGAAMAKHGPLRYRVFDFRGPVLLGQQWIEVGEQEGEQLLSQSQWDAISASGASDSRQVTVQFERAGIREAVAQAKAQVRTREREAVERVRARLRKEGD